MKEVFFAYMDDPTAERFVLLQAALVHGEGYDPYSGDLAEAVELSAAGRHAEAADTIVRGLPNLMLNPRAHLILAAAAEAKGDEQTANVERYIATQMVRGVELTGDGSPKRPFRVTRIEDEYDLMSYHQNVVAGQKLIGRGDREYDVLTIQGGGEVWFDITQVKRNMRRGGESEGEGPV